MGFADAFIAAKESKQRETLLKAQLAEINAQNKQREIQAQGLAEFIGLLQSQSVQPGSAAEFESFNRVPFEQAGNIQDGQVQSARSLADILTDADLQRSGLKAGLFDPLELAKLQQAKESRIRIENLIRGNNSDLTRTGNEFVPEDYVIDSSGGITPKLTRRKVHNEVLSQDLKSVIQYDQFGREMGRRPAGPDELTPAAKTIATEQAKMEISTKGAKAIVAHAKKLASDIFTDDSLWKRFKNMGANAVNLALQNDPRLIAYTSFVGGTRASIIRALGEKGTLTDGDQQRAAALFPDVFGFIGLPDSKKVAEAKFAQLEQVIESIATGKPLAEAMADAGIPDPVGDASGSPKKIGRFEIISISK